MTSEISSVLEAKLYGDDKIRAMIANAPIAMRNAFKHFLYSTRKSYVGNRNTAGSFRKSILRQRIGVGANTPFKRDGLWDKKVASAFTGIVNRSNQIGDMSLVMHPYGQEGFIAGLGMMDRSTPNQDVNSSTNMIMPAYQNIRNLGYSLRGNKSKLMQEVLGNEQTFSIKKGDSVLVFMDENRTHGGSMGGMGMRSRGVRRMKLRKSALLFVLKKHFTMKKKFDFIGQFNSGQSKYINRFKNIIDRQVRGLEKINPKTGKTYVEFR